MHLLRHLVISVLHGIWAGALVLGIGGRLFMRLIAWYNGSPLGFSWGGTAEVVLLGAIIGAISAPFIDFISSWSKLSATLTGIFCGLGLYLIILVIPMDGKAAANAFPSLKVGIHLGFALIFIIFCSVISCMAKRNTGNHRFQDE